MPGWKVRDVLTAITTFAMVIAVAWCAMDLLFFTPVSEVKARVYPLVIGLGLGWASGATWSRYCAERDREEDPPR